MDSDRMTERNRKVFDTFPDAVYAGRLRHGRKSGMALKMSAAAAMILIPLLMYLMPAHDELDVQPSSPVALFSQRVYTVNDGVKGMVTLPDSTQIWLNGGSLVRLEDDFENRRSIYIEGEGYFNVKADEGNPFYIKTSKDVTVKVTGTEFNLCCYNEQPDVRISLVKGSVELLKGEKTILKMSDNEKASIRGGEVESQEEGGLEESLAWTKGSLRFENTPMKEVLVKLEHWYGVDIVVEDIRIYNSSFTGDFRSESLVQVLELLEITSGVKYSINSNTVRLGL